MSMIEIGSIQIQLNRKTIKNLHISVLPPDGRVRVSAPEKMTETAIRMAVIKRLPWIKEQQKSFLKQARESKREMIRGESHYLWGKRYLLDTVVANGRHDVYITKNKILISVSPSTCLERKEFLLNEFYRDQLKHEAAHLFDHWQPIIGTRASHWSIKKMKTKWGSCNTDSQRILLNLSLARVPPECLEYIIVHELIHLRERHHNEHFQELMQQYLPNWKERRNLLNSTLLSHQEW